MIIKQPIHLVEKPKIEVFLDGKPIKHEDCSVDLNSFDEADNFSFTALWNIGGEDILSSNAVDETLLVSKKDIPVIVKLNKKTIIDGLVDVPSWGFGMQGDSVNINGRGKIGRLVDEQKTRNIKNRTASSIANEIFAYHGLKANVTSTSHKVGTYSEDNQTSNVDMNDWELLNWLAEWEGFVVRVKGTEGFFGPLDGIPELKLSPIPFTYGKDCEIERLERHKFGAREVIVEGRSYFGKKTLVEYYPRKPKKENETAIIKRYTLTGLSQEQLRTRVKSIHKQLTKYDITGTLRTDRYVEIDTDRRIQLFGVGRGLSQNYYVTQVRYSETVDDFTIEISFANKLEEVV